MKIVRTAAIIIMAITTVFFIVFAQIQRGYATAAMKEAEEQRELSKENAKRAKKTEQMAIELAVQVRYAENKARLNAEEAEEIRRQLMNCKNK